MIKQCIEFIANAMHQNNYTYKQMCAAMLLKFFMIRKLMATSSGFRLLKREVPP